MEQNPRYRKLIIVIITTLVIAGIGFLLIWLFTPPAPTREGEPTSFFGRLPIVGRRAGPEVQREVPATVPQPTPGEIPSAEEKRRLIQITNEPVIGPVIDETRQKVLYYRKRDGHLVAASFTGGQEETISNTTILNITDVVWSPDRKRAVVTYQDGELLKKFVTEATSTPKVSFLPQESHSPAWSPDSRALFWMTRQDKNYTLTSASPDGRTPKSRGFTTPIPDLLLAMLTPEKAALVPKTASISETPILVLNIKTLVQNTVTSGFGMTTINDNGPKTELIAYGSTNKLGAMQNIHTLDIQSGKDTEWALKTLTEKCVFSDGSEKFFCAVPQEIPARDMPEAWYQGRISFSDTFFRVDLKTNKAEQIFGASGLDAVSLTVSADNRYLFFVDKKIGFLYSLALE